MEPVCYIMRSMYIVYRIEVEREKGVAANSSLNEDLRENRKIPSG